ncbi:hypothetical protein MPSEU_000210700 [Mayamaea pseudoterrestris]|nr:hypothetical protein MPSEU_000210700 [Mayamaea pseudoterrestris]
MSFEGKKDNERVETENVDASDVGDMNEMMEGIDHDDDADEADDDVDEVDETRSYNDAHDASIALDEDDDITVKTNGDDSSQGGEEDLDEEDDDDEDDVEGTPRSHQVDTTPKSKPNKAAQTLSGNKKGRAPSVSGLSIPFRTIKKAMKLDPDTPIVQNEAAVYVLDHPCAFICVLLTVSTLSAVT